MSGINRMPLRFITNRRYRYKNKFIKMATKVKATASKPGAWVVNSKDRGRKSIKNGKVYLNDKEEFQIELYNPLQKCVLADIKLNGSSISKAGLVLNPGQRFYLDCFIEDNKKFIFNTYEVENTDEVKEAIAKNGLLEVHFYEESVNTLESWGIRDYFYPYWRRTYPYNPWWYTNDIYYSNINLTTGGNFYCNTTTTSGDFCNQATFDSNMLGGLSLTNISNNIETGRVDKGDKSNQKFESVDMDFSSYIIASTVIHLLPESRKPLEVKDIKKSSNVTQSSEQMNSINLLSKLGELHKAGVLTDEEFTSKKAELLSKI